MFGILMCTCADMCGQTGASRMEPLDPSRNVSAPVLEKSIHTPLPEQYVWTAEDNPSPRGSAKADEPELHYFRAHFSVSAVPREATLYIAGPRAVSVWLNGQLLEKVESDPNSPLRIHVFAAPVARALRAGDNLIAIEAVRRRGGTSAANSTVLNQVNSGQILVAKIVPAAQGVEAPDLMHSGPNWRGAVNAENGWEQPAFHDADWKPVTSPGGIESNIDMFQWNADAGMYDWPGYDGLSPFLAHMPLHVEHVLGSFAGRGSIDGLKNLESGSGELVVHMPAAERDRCRGAECHAGLRSRAYRAPGG